MSLNKLLAKLTSLVVMLIFLSSSTFAANWYVNSTNGNDVAFDGTAALTPFKTIEKAIASATAGDKIFVAAGTYTEVAVDMDKDLTFEVTVFQNSQTAILNNGLIIDSDVVFTTTGGNFQVATATLTDGSLTLASSNLTVTAGGTLTVTDGTISATPTYAGAINIVYTSTAAYSSGAEVPSDFNGGTLDINSGFDITINKAFDAATIIVQGAGDLYLKGNVKLNTDINNATTIDLGGNTLTFNPAANATITALGTIETGTFVLDGNKTITHTAAAVLPDVVIPASRTNSFTTAGNLTVDSFTLSSSVGNAFLFGGAHTLNIKGNLTRNDNTVGNLDATTNSGVVNFLGTGPSTFDPGANLTLHDLTVNKTGSAVVTLDASVEVVNNVTITTGALELGDYNITLTGTGVTFDNSGSFYSTTGNGYIVFENADAGGVGVVGVPASIASTAGGGEFGNILINLTDDDDHVDVVDNIKFSGTLFINQGDFNLNGGNIEFTADVVANPLVRINTTGAGVPAFTRTAAETVTYTAKTSLQYEGTGNGGVYAAGLEWLGDPADLYNVSVITTGGVNVTGAAAAATATGALLVNGTETLTLGANLTLAGAGVAHTVKGTVTANDLIVDGNGSSINGSTTNTDARTIVSDLMFTTAAGETATVSNIASVTNVDVANGDVTMNLIATAAADAQFLGTLNITDGSLTLSIPGVAADASAQEVAGAVTIVDGTLVMGNSFQTLSTVGVGAAGTDTGSIELNGYTLTLKDDFTFQGTGDVSGAGWLDINYTANGNFTLTSPLSVSNLLVSNGAGIVTTQVTDDLTVTNELKFKANATGVYDVNALDIKVTGQTVQYESGLLNATGGGNLILNSASAMTLNLKADFTSNPDVKLDAPALAIVDINSAAGAHDFIIAGDFTQTKGDIDLQTNELYIQTDFTRTAGNYTMTSGAFVFDGPGTITQGTGFSVDNLVVTATGAATMQDKPFRVEKKLTLANSLDANTVPAAAPYNLTFAADATIERQANAATLAEVAEYEGNINLAYTTAAAITTSSERTATTINNVDIALPTTVTLNGDITINGTLTLTGKLNDAGDDVNMAANSTVKLVNQNGTTALPGGAVVPAGALNVYYSNASGGILATTNNELNKNWNINNVTVDGASGIAPDDIQLHDNITVNGLILINDDGDLDMNAKNLTIAGNVQFTSTGRITNTGATAGLYFTGAANKDLTLAAEWIVGANINFHVNMAANNVALNLKGADLDLNTNALVLNLDKGVFSTDDDVAVLLYHGKAGNVIQQGFVRTAPSVITGNARKIVPAGDAVVVTNIQFPVGSDPTATEDANYRPATFFFPNGIAAQFELTVNHQDVNPGGTNGILPGGLDGGDGVTITNYPDFYWFVDSDLTLNPSYAFDVELQAEGYPYYQFDEIQDVRMIRRDSGNVANQWRLQGTAANYDNSTINQDWPVAKVIAAKGGITTQGSRFSFSQSNLAPVITKDVASPQVINEGDTLVVNYAATDQDLGDIATLEVVSKPETASYVATDVSNGKLTWITTQADTGTVSIIIKATDNYTLVSYDTLVVTVNDITSAPVFTKTMGDTTARATYDFSFQYAGNDPDGNAVSYFLSAVTGATTADTVEVSAAGLLTWTPALADVDSTVYVTVGITDGMDTTYVTDTLTVVGNTTPVWVSVLPDTTVYVGDTLKWTYKASDADNDAISYAFDSNWPENEASLDAATGEFTWVPTTASQFPVVVPVTATDGTDTLTTQANVVVKVITVDVAGVVVYNNVAMDPITGAAVKLMQGETEVATTTTDSTGAYTFTGVNAGDYTVMVSSDAMWPSNAVLADDALLAARSAIDTTVVLSDLQKLAGDVTGDDVVNAFDALQILQRVVKMTSSFAIADWQFEVKEITVGTNNVTANVKAIAAGDVNSSYAMADVLAKKEVAVIEEEALRISPKAEFELPIRLDAVSEVSAFTFRFAYPAEKMELVSVKSKAKGLVSSAKDGVISLAWADLSLNNALVVEDDAVVVLKFKATEEFAKSEVAGLSLELGSVVNVLGKDVSASVSLQSAEIAIPETFALNQNYPNPFNPTTTIAYDMPVAGKVTLKVFNTLGQEVTTLVNEVLEAGSHKAMFNATNMASGIYFFNITVEGTKNFVQTKKMVLLK